MSHLLTPSHSGLGFNTGTWGSTHSIYSALQGCPHFRALAVSVPFPWNSLPDLQLVCCCLPFRTQHKVNTPVREPLLTEESPSGSCISIASLPLTFLLVPFSEGLLFITVFVSTWSDVKFHERPPSFVHRCIPSI